jgi:hypothetical protein
MIAVVIEEMEAADLSAPSLSPVSTPFSSGDARGRKDSELSLIFSGEFHLQICRRGCSRIFSEVYYPYYPVFLDTLSPTP